MAIYSLIVEDDFISRNVLLNMLIAYGPCDVATDGKEGIDAVRKALEGDRHYDLICLDIQMPNMDGQTVLKEIRQAEQAHGLNPGHGARVVMTTVLKDPANIMGAFKNQCEAYIVKPVDEKKLLETLVKLDLLQD
jgi:two-component system chemotaxis response regulator CheY